MKKIPSQPAPLMIPKKQTQLHNPSTHTHTDISAAHTGTKTTRSTTQHNNEPETKSPPYSRLPRGIGPALLALPRGIGPVVPVHPPPALPSGSIHLQLPLVDLLQDAIPLTHARLSGGFSGSSGALSRPLLRRGLLVVSGPRSGLPLQFIIVHEDRLGLGLGLRLRPRRRRRRCPSHGGGDRLSHPASVPGPHLFIVRSGGGGVPRFASAGEGDGGGVKK